VEAAEGRLISRSDSEADVATTGPEDPGWRPNLKQMLKHHVTPWSVKPRYQQGVHPLTTLRSLYLSLLLAGPLMLYVVTFISPYGDPSPALAAGLGAVGVVCLAASRWAWNRELKIGSREELAQSFRSTFFLAFALSEIPMLVSFAVSVARDEWWPFLIGLGFFLVGMASIAPTRGRLQAKDDELRARGSPHLLTEVLADPPETTGA
jgi:hypothetical protein